ncbi:MAG: hypothetical protein E7568_02400 [Ruminococcaceae bacterium]|nr:hypothetical protein [Oscillospiraceae bacterium]
MIKKFICIYCALLLLPCFDIDCFAYNDSYKHNKFLYDESEHNIAALSILPSKNYSNPKTDIEFSCKMYAIDYTYENINKLKEGIYLDTLVVEKDYWHFTVKEDTYVSLYKDNNGNYTVFESGDYSEMKKLKEFADLPEMNFDYVEEKILSLGTTLDDDELVVKMIYSRGNYFTRDDRHFYIRYNGDQYVIPYGPFVENYGGLNIGQLYTMEEWINFVETTINKGNPTSVDNKQEAKINILPYVIISGCVVVICAAVVFVIVKKRKINN